MLPLRDVVVYPEVTIPLYLDRQSSIQSAQMVLQADRAAPSGRGGSRRRRLIQDRHYRGDPADFAYTEQPLNGRMGIREGADAGRPRSGNGSTGRAGNSPGRKSAVSSESLNALRETVVSRFESYARGKKIVAKGIRHLGVASLGDMLVRFHRMDLSTLVDFIAAHMSMRLAQKQDVLELLDIRQRLEYIDAATRNLEADDPESA